MHELSDFRKGLRVMVEGNPYSVVDFQHVKPGKGNQFTRCKLRNLLTGQLLERTFKSGERFEVPNVEFRDVTFLYKDDNGYTFMDKTSYEQLTLNETEVGENKNYLIENLESQMMIYNDRPVGIQVPNAVNLRITQTDPGFKGNTVTNTFKAATLETGYVIQVPLHMKEGDLIRVDTRTGDYVERVNT